MCDSSHQTQKSARLSTQNQVKTCEVDKFALTCVHRVQVLGYRIFDVWTLFLAQNPVLNPVWMVVSNVSTWSRSSCTGIIKIQTCASVILPSVFQVKRRTHKKQTCIQTQNLQMFTYFWMEKWHNRIRMLLEKGKNLENQNLLKSFLRYFSIFIMSN